MKKKATRNRNVHLTAKKKEIFEGSAAKKARRNAEEKSEGRNTKTNISKEREIS